MLHGSEAEWYDVALSLKSFLKLIELKQPCEQWNLLHFLINFLVFFFFIWISEVTAVVKLWTNLKYSLPDLHAHMKMFLKWFSQSLKQTILQNVFKWYSISFFLVELTYPNLTKWCAKVKVKKKCECCAQSPYLDPRNRASTGWDPER